MSGAYVAKPAVVSVPDVPPGWDPDWPSPGVPGYDPDPFFPAPFPPGYVTDYSMVVTATSTIHPADTVSATSSLRDQLTYATNEPSDITWYAAIDGVGVNLKFAGGEFAPSVTESAAFATYWGTTPSIVLNLSNSNHGDTVILQAFATITNSEGQAEVVTAFANIAVLRLFTIKVSADSAFIAQGTPAPNNEGRITIGIDKIADGEDLADWEYSTDSTILITRAPAPPPVGYTQTDDYVDSDFPLTLDADLINREFEFDISSPTIGWYYAVYIRARSRYWLSASNCELEILVDGSPVNTESRALSASSSSGSVVTDGGLSVGDVWLTIDGTTEVVTVVNP